MCGLYNIRGKTAWRAWLMDVPEYESLNLLFSSCLAVHLLLVPLAPFLMVMLGLLNCEHKGKKLSSPVILSGKFPLTWTHEKSYWSVLTAWTLMAEEKLALVWWEALNTSSTAFGACVQIQGKTGPRGVLPAEAEGHNNSTLQGWWHFCGKAPGALCTQQSGREADSSWKTPEALQPRAGGLKWSAGGTFQKRLVWKNQSGTISYTHETSLEDAWK